MADSEWFRIDPAPNGGEDYPNFESADAAAQQAASRGSVDEVFVVRCTSTRIRRYTRQVTVTSEDITPPA